MQQAQPIILSLDASSTTIGWVLWDGTVRDQGTIKLTGSDIADRCRQAFAAVGLMIEAHPDIDCIAIESPVARLAKAVIPQARVSGAILARAALLHIPICEVTPSEGKRALAGSGNATKDQMMVAAFPALRIYDEHMADALGIALFAKSKVRVTPLETI